MGNKVTFDYSKTDAFVSAHEMESMKKIAEAAKEELLSREGAGNDFLGWIDLPVDYDKEEFARIKKAAEKIKSDSEVLIVIGIGGSYLGARAAIEFLRHNFYNMVSKEIRKTPEIYFAGNSISSTYLKHLIQVIGDRDFSVNIISKSGTTTEPAIAFRVFKDMLEKKYGKEEAAKRIYATTDKARGALKKLSDEEGYEEFVVPDDVGGRFSVLTAVGLLPIAVSGADIDKLMEGAAAGREMALNQKFEENDAVLYAAIRNILHRKGKSVEILANYEPSLHYVSEWWKQLYGESEGKDQKKIAQMIKRIEKLIKRINKKLKHLSKEEQLELHRKRAEKQNDTQKESLLRNELKTRRSKRRKEERNYALKELAQDGKNSTQELVSGLTGAAQEGTSPDAAMMGDLGSMGMDAGAMADFGGIDVMA